MSENTFIGLMKEDDIRRFWSDIAISLDAVPRLQETITKDELLAGALSGNVQFWAAGRNETVELFAATEIVQYKTSRALRVLALVGKNLDVYWERALAQLDRLGEELRCDELEADTVRSGMSLFLQKQAGFSIRSISLVRKIKKRSVH